MRKTTLTIILFLASGVAFAADGHGDEIPSKLIFWQFFNLTILFLGLVYFLRQPVKDYFKERRAAFLATAEKSQSARAAAENSFKDLKQKIEDLDRTKSDTLARAEAEAGDLRKQMVLTANETANRIRKEADVTTQMELMRAKRELQGKFAEEAVSAARLVLEKDISAQDQAKLQGDFVKHIEGVRP